MGRLFDDEPDRSPRFDPFNPFREEISLLRNGYLIGMILAVPFLIAIWLVGQIFRLLFWMLGALISKMVGQGSAPQSTDSSRLGRSFADPDSDE